jgi:hypothetical protein
MDINSVRDIRGETIPVFTSEGRREDGSVRFSIDILAFFLRKKDRGAAFATVYCEIIDHGQEVHAMFPFSAHQTTPTTCRGASIAPTPPNRSKCRPNLSHADRLNDI